MGYVTLAILGITLLCVLFGALLGLVRGFRRSLVRLILVIVSLLLAVFVLRKTFVNVIMNINVGGETLEQTLIGALNESGELPASIMSLISALVEIILGLVGYFVVYGALSAITWMLIYPIIKIFVKKEQPKKKLLGAIIGLVQGLIIAFTVCAPITGLVTQIDKISEVKVNGEQIIDLPENIGIEDYVNSFPGKVYGKLGGWYFDILTTTKTEDGNKVSIDDTISVLVTITNIADTATDLGESIDIMTNESSTPQQRIDAMKNLGDDLISIGNSINDLSNDAKDMVNDLIIAVKDLINEDGADPTLEDALADFDINNINMVGAGSAMKGIATYIEKTDDTFASTQAVSQDDVNSIVNGLAENDFILSMLAGDETPTLLDVESEHESMFASAIESTSLPLEDKVTLLELFGLI